MPSKVYSAAVVGVEAFEVEIVDLLRANHCELRFPSSKSAFERSSFRRHRGFVSKLSAAHGSSRPGEDHVSYADPNQLCTLATILPRTCPSASRCNAFGIASKVICSATLGVIFPTCTSVITSVAIRPKSSCRRRKAGEARTPPKPIS